MLSDAGQWTFRPEDNGRHQSGPTAQRRETQEPEERQHGCVGEEAGRRREIEEDVAAGRVIVIGSSQRRAQAIVGHGIAVWID